MKKNKFLTFIVLIFGLFVNFITLSSCIQPSVPATDFSINSSLSISVGKTAKLKVTLIPKNATGRITFATSNANYATVDEKTGVITAIKANNNQPVSIIVTVDGVADGKNCSLTIE